VAETVGALRRPESGGWINKLTGSISTMPPPPVVPAAAQHLAPKTEQTITAVLKISAADQQLPIAALAALQALAGLLRAGTTRFDLSRLAARGISRDTLSEPRSYEYIRAEPLGDGFTVTLMAPICLLRPKGSPKRAKPSRKRHGVRWQVGVGAVFPKTALADHRNAIGAAGIWDRASTDPAIGVPGTVPAAGRTIAARH
jgi:hypothetical protein